MSMSQEEAFGDFVKIVIQADDEILNSRSRNLYNILPICAAHLLISR